MREPATAGDVVGDDPGAGEGVTEGGHEDDVPLPERGGEGDLDGLDEEEPARRGERAPRQELGAGAEGVDEVLAGEPADRLGDRVALGDLPDDGREVGEDRLRGVRGEERLPRALVAEGPRAAAARTPRAPSRCRSPAASPWAPSHAALPRSPRIGPHPSMRCHTWSKSVARVTTPSFMSRVTPGVTSPRAPTRVAMPESTTIARPAPGRTCACACACDRSPGASTSPAAAPTDQTLSRGGAPWPSRSGVSASTRSPTSARPDVSPGTSTRASGSAPVRRTRKPRRPTSTTSTSTAATSFPYPTLSSSAPDQSRRLLDPSDIATCPAGALAQVTSYPAVMERLVDAGGTRLCIDEHGEPGAPLVIELEGHLAQLVSVPPGYRDRLVDAGLRVVLVDHRDIGRSQRFPGSAYTLHDLVADTHALVGVLGGGPAVVVGRSMGGMVAQLLALIHPEDVGGLGLYFTAPAAAHASPDDPTRPRFAGYPAFADEAAFTAWEHAGLPGLAGPAYPFAPGSIDALSRRMWARGVDPSGWTRQRRAMDATPPWSHRLPDVRVPATVVHGRADAVVPLAAGERLAALLPDATLHVVPGMGHQQPPELDHFFADVVLDLAERAGFGVRR